MRPDLRLWPMFLVLLAAVLVPTACVLWFMQAAMQNERLAVREKLIRFYQARLDEARSQIDAHWNARRNDFNLLLHPGSASAPESETAGEAFVRLARAGKADSFIILDESGRPAYPNAVAILPEVPPSEPSPPATMPGMDLSDLLAQAEEAEFAQATPARAAELYAQIAAQAHNEPAAARALLAQARSLAKAGQKDQALQLLCGSLEETRYQHALDAQGRLIIAAARLLALDTMGRDDARFAAGAARLIEQVNDYRHLHMPASQRLFLMTRLAEMLPDAPLPTLAAERAAVLASGLSTFDEPPTAQRLMTWYAGPEALKPGAEIKHLRSALLSADGRVYALFSGQRVLDETEKLLNRGPGAAEATIYAVNSVVPRPELGPPFLTAPASDRHMSDWTLALHLNGPDPFAAAAQRQNMLYLWTGGLGVLSIVLLAAALAAYLSRQVRLTRLKNDLIATVSHELKTPLASMRVLVDTLREGRCRSDQQARDYFELLARENQRLSRLIDNFLTFSRMERNKQTFDFRPVDMVTVAQEALDAVSERFAGPNAQLTVDLPAELPGVHGDRDALVTVVLNLLDNAWKYSGDAKRVQVRGYADNGAVVMEVTDAGAGMPRRTLKRIFEKFYQVDQTLSRQAGGCGLGLSIVKFILDAHGGTIDVKSQVGKGSTFTVRLPAAAREHAHAR